MKKVMLRCAINTKTEEKKNNKTKNHYIYIKKTTMEVDEQKVEAQETAADDQGAAVPATPEQQHEEMSGIQFMGNAEEYEKFKSNQPQKPPEEKPSGATVGSEIDKEKPESGADAGSGLPADATATDGSAEAASSAAAGEGSEGSSVQSQQVDDQLSDEDYFNALSESTGYEMSSDEQIVDTIKSLHEQVAKSIPKDKLSPALQQAIEYEQKGGDVRRMFEVMSVDPEKISPKEALRQKFMLDNSDLVKTKPEFATMKFEREYRDKYGILSESLDESDFDDDSGFFEWKSNKEYAQNEMEFEAAKAKSAISEMSKSLIKDIPESKNKVSDEDLAKMREDYLNSANEFEEAFEVIELPVDPEGKQLFNIGLNDKSRPLFSDWIKNPHRFYEAIGISPDGKSIDMDRFGAHLAMTAMLSVEGEDGLGYLLSKYLQENTDLNTIEKRLVNPKTNSIAASGGGEDEMTAAMKELAAKGQGTYRPYYYPKKE